MGHGNFSNHIAPPRLGRAIEYGANCLSGTMFDEDYYADLESVPERWQIERPRLWRRLLFASPLLLLPGLAAEIMEIPVAVLVVFAVVIAFAIYLFLVAQLESDRTGFRCGYPDCRRLIHSTSLWDCPSCGSSPWSLRLTTTFLGKCPSCDRKPLTILCPHCKRSLPLVRPDAMPSPPPPPATISLSLLARKAGGEPPASVAPQQEPAKPPDDLADVSKFLDR
jgi:hypothetical protein